MKTFFAIIFTLYSNLALAMVFIVSFENGDLVIQGANAHSSTKSITITASQLGVDNIQDCFYNESGWLAVITNEGLFEIRDIHTDHGGIEVTLYNQNNNPILSWNENSIDIISCQEGFSDGESVLAVQSCISHLSLSDPLNKARLTAALENRCSGSVKLSTVLFNTEKHYDIGNLSFRTQEKLKELFSYFDKKSLIAFLNFIYPGRIISEHGIKLLQSWYEEWFKTK
ncbi:hypothetical protein [Endozoicomonas lisbonensis]|uniref:DUF4369 domain-containing protein n=1 Tax=Endozoicomonas lisbonensis TaxID=3120522 RepID=A0ABV2SJJ9_9GAMM